MRSAPVALASLGAAAGAVHAAVNARLLATPAADPPPCTDRVAVLLPARDEAHQVGAAVRSVLAQRGVPDLQLLVLDDGSSDGTGEVVRTAADGDPRVTLLAGTGEPPSGWLGKTWACHRLADGVDADVLVFLDADVVLHPHALAACVALLRERGLDLVSPYPRQLTPTVGTRLVQPLLQWTWLTFLPVAAALTSARGSLSAANGQLLVIDARAYRRAGGHESVAGQVIEDVALLRAIKAVGGRGGVVDGTDLAVCRMYGGTREMMNGYAKSLWASGGTPAGSAALAGLLAALYLLPPAAALRGSRVGLAGTAAGVAGRLVAARRTGGRPLDALAHPLSVAALVALTARSIAAHRRGGLTWKGRAL